MEDYKHIAILDKNNDISMIDLGLIHSSAAREPRRILSASIKTKRHNYK